MTYKAFYQAVINANINDELTEFANNAIAKLDEKNRKKRETTSPAQAANEDIKNQILDEFAANPKRVYTARELADIFSTSTQHISALLKQLTDDGKVTKFEKVKDSKKNTVRGYQYKTEEVGETEDEVE